MDHMSRYESRSRRITALLPISSALQRSVEQSTIDLGTHIRFAVRDLERLNDIEILVERGELTPAKLRAILEAP
jgi:hypothetical protein